MKKILLIILTLSTQVSADTIINSTYYNNKNINWNKAGSPYIINGPINFSSSTLNISDAKVIIKNGSINLFNKSVVSMQDVSIENLSDTYAISSFNSKVSMNMGQINSSRFIESYSGEVYMEGLSSLNSSNKELFSIYNNSNFSLENSRIENYKGTALNFFGADTINIKNNEFINNKKVMEIYSASSTKINTNDFESNDIAIESYVQGGDFENNFFQKEKPNIYPYTTDAPSNENNIIAGPFTINTFSKIKNIKKAELCCSNILFLPGVMGSRLYTTENQLWEPNRNADIKKLYLDEFGKSINNIFTKDIIVKTNIVGGLPYVDKDIYKDFDNYLQKIKKQKIITDYNEMPYDWRMSADYILNEGVKFKDKNINLVQVVKDLQKTSKTKKITIITHSNGGLVAKQLILELQKSGLENLIDKVIFVAMPEYGTAQAITALMFGHQQSIAGGLIMRSSIARELGKNMPTAYTLLPSEKYYTYNIHADKLLQETVIRNYSRINQSLLDKSKALHQQLDNIVYPKDVALYQILGTGVSTLSDIKIDDKNLYKLIPLYEKNGDGVVQDLHSSRQGTVLYVDLNNTIYKHANIMNNQKIIGYINNIVNPPRIDIPEIGLDYNKIIKNNNYKLLRITPSNPNNKLSQYLTPLDMELSIGMSKINDNIDNELYFDRYSANTTNDFRQALEHLNNNRFEEFDDGINYLYTTDMENFSIKPKIDNTVDISILESIGGEMSSVKYQGVPIFKNSEMSFEPSDNSNSLDITLPTTGQIIKLSDEKIKPQMSLDDKINQVVLSINSSKMDRYLKDRYIRRIELYRMNKDTAYLKTIKKRTDDAIKSINSLLYSKTLKSRYAKLKEDYIYLSFLLLNL